MQSLPRDLVTFTEEILNGKLHFWRSEGTTGAKCVNWISEREIKEKSYQSTEIPVDCNGI